MTNSSKVREGSPHKRAAYLFLDEGGNLDFSATGTNYFTMTSVMTYRPFLFDGALAELRYDLIEAGYEMEYFHATEDKQDVRDKVFGVIRNILGSFQADSIIVEKRKVAPQVREEERFFPEILGYLVRYVVKGTDLSCVSQFIVMTDLIPVNRKRRAVERAVKIVLAKMLPPGLSYRVLHRSSKSCMGLQVADYFNWAIYRAWEGGDYRSLKLVANAVQSQFAIFQQGYKDWY